MSVPLQEINRSGNNESATAPPSEGSAMLDASSHPTPVVVTAQPSSGIGGRRTGSSGLDYLSSVDQLLVKQRVENSEIFSGFESNNKYAIKNALGQNIYYAAEESDSCERQCQGPRRSFYVRVFDNFKKEVMQFYRPSTYCGCGEVEILDVSAPPGNTIGCVEVEQTYLFAKFLVKDQNGQVVATVEGEMSFGGSREFRVLNTQGNQIGMIKKQWSGLGKELFTDADNFGITFPLNLDKRIKAILLGATILVDMKYFEH